MRSDLMKKGVDRIPHRALFRALGLTDEELSRPICIWTRSRRP